LLFESRERRIDLAGDRNSGSLILGGVYFDQVLEFVVINVIYARKV
jgi:hypothetical protein